MGGDPLSGFMQGYNIGALNHTGGDIDGGELPEVVIDEPGRMFLERNGLIYRWDYDGGGYSILCGELSLRPVFPEFDILALGRGLYNMASSAIREIPSLGAAARGFTQRGTTQYIEGFGYVGKEAFHRGIKNDILKASGSYAKFVGTNPNIAVGKSGEIILKGVGGGYRGKAFSTGLKAVDFFK